MNSSFLVSVIRITLQTRTSAALKFYDAATLAAKNIDKFIAGKDVDKLTESLPDPTSSLKSGQS